ncbi:LysR family transcriptional regulator [Pseudooceanicola sp. HF7]|uniref:LysR family transcriptional regulator n=1 Tax=Pseudooceanicola sp. HF7 TaxID=2721560 RepID=UPI0014311E7E|nr:LysR family transcriptional regulator [Pseudooceanicola sp. HF7]NIZ11413.1 LysR family transcriptional regulator [Pseudooceanicola sp. HF7]
MTGSPGRITLWGIEVFVATAHERSITAAARRLGASPSAVSQQLTNLETALEAELLDRSARPMTLTRAGEAFRRRAESILNEAAQARAELALADGPALTRLRLGVIEDFEADVTPRLLSRMAGLLTDCRFLLETGASHSLHDQLDAQALDIVVAAEMGEAPAWAETHPILTEGFVVATRRGTVDPARDLLAQLKTMPMIQYTTRHYMGRLIATHLAQQNLKLDHRFELDSYHAILAMVHGGAGWTILPPLALLRARPLLNRLDTYALPFPPLTRRITLTARKGLLEDVPARLAAELRGLLQEITTAVDTDDYPWLPSTVQIAEGGAA